MTTTFDSNDSWKRYVLGFSIGGNWNISGVPVLPEKSDINVLLKVSVLFRAQAHNTGT